VDAFEAECRAVVAQARAEVAKGREPQLSALTARLQEAARTARERGASKAAVARARKRAVEQLERIVAVHRARARLAQEAAPPAARALPRRARTVLRTRPTVSGNMRLRREGDGAAAVLVWDPAPGVERWEVRISERPDARGDYEVRETLELDPVETRVPLPLGERAVRVHVLGRGRGGRLVRRAIVAGLTRDAWRDRWQQRATAS
jgi:hypothetical protein